MSRIFSISYNRNSSQFDYENYEHECDREMKNWFVDSIYLENRDQL